MPLHTTVCRFSTCCDVVRASWNSWSTPVCLPIFVNQHRKFWVIQPPCKCWRVFFLLFNLIRYKWTLTRWPIRSLTFSFLFYAFATLVKQLRSASFQLSFLCDSFWQHPSLWTICSVKLFRMLSYVLNPWCSLLQNMLYKHCLTHLAPTICPS